MNDSSPAPEREPLWTVADTASYLRVSKCWVYRRVEAGELPHGRFGGVLRFNPNRIREYAAAQQTTADGGAKVVALASRRPKGRR